MDISTWQTYKNDYFGIEFKYPANFQKQIENLNPEYEYGFPDLLFSVKLNDYFYVKIASRHNSVSYDKGVIADYLQSNYFRYKENSDYSDNGYYFEVEKLQEEGNNYKVTVNKKYDFVKDPKYKILYLTLFEKDDLAFVIETNFNEDKNVDAILEISSNIVDNFKFIDKKKLPEIKYTPRNIVSDCDIKWFEIGKYPFCSHGLECVNIRFCQDGATIFSSDLLERYDFSKEYFRKLSKEEKKLFSLDIIEAVENNRIKAYSRDNLVYFVKNDYVYTVYLEWFTNPLTDEANKQILKGFKIE